MVLNKEKINYKATVEYKEKRWAVVDSYGVERLSPTRHFYETGPMLDIIPIKTGRFPDDLITVSAEDVRLIENTYSQ